MGAPAWTPGPWTTNGIRPITDDGKGTITFHTDQPYTHWEIKHTWDAPMWQSTRWIGEVRPTYGYEHEAEANARLIAAAPSLYEALARCEAMVSTVDGPPDWDWVRSVLAKARGESA